MRNWLCVLWEKTGENEAREEEEAGKYLFRMRWTREIVVGLFADGGDFHFNLYHMQMAVDLPECLPDKVMQVQIQ